MTCSSGPHPQRQFHRETLGVDELFFFAGAGGWLIGEDEFLVLGVDLRQTAFLEFSKEDLVR